MDSLTNSLYCMQISSTNSNVLKDRYPDIFATLHPTKNLGIDVNKLTIGNSKTKVWWTCFNNKCGHHEWETLVSVRVNAKGCKFCSGRAVCKCFSIMNNPQWVKEFAVDLNPKIDLHTIAPHSNKKYWWRCTDHTTCTNHIWLTSPNVKGSCPFCINRQTCSCDSIMSVPRLRDSFHETLNTGIDPYKVAKFSHVMIWWKCLVHTSCGEHVWQSVALSRSSGTDCPFCCNQQICKCNSFMNNQILNKEFIQELNHEIDPWKISAGADIKLWWRCSTCDYEWGAFIYARTGGNQTGCPYCASIRKESIGYSFCKKYLTDKNIQFVTEYKISQILPSRRYDFMFEYNDKKWILEYDGTQHFRQTGWYDDENFKNNQEIDKIKNCVALIMGFNFIRIHYKDEILVNASLDYFLNLKLDSLTLSFDDQETYLHMKSSPDFDVLNKVCSRYSNDIINYKYNFLFVYFENTLSI